MISDAKRVLILNHCNPFANGGGSYASHAYIKAFAELFNGEVDVCYNAENTFPVDETIKVNNYIKVAKRSQIHRILSIITGDIQRYTPFLKKHLRNHPQLYSMAVLNGSYEGGALVDLCHKYGLKVVTIHHNFDPEYDKDNTPSWYRAIFCRHVYQLQKKAYKRSDYNLFLTRDDIKLCLDAFGETEAVNKLIGIFEFKEIIPPPFLTKKGRLLTFVITGSLCTQQGVDGIVFFFKELYKMLPKECRVVIAGRLPTPEVIKYCSLYSNVELISNPADMNSVIINGDIYICPTRLGGGLKLRIMDGLRLGLPVITHVCSSRGYDLFDKSPYFRSFSNPEEFKNSIDSLLRLYKEDKIEKKKIFNKYSEAFSFESGLNRLRTIFMD